MRKKCHKTPICGRCERIIRSLCACKLISTQPTCVCRKPRPMYASF